MFMKYKSSCLQYINAFFFFWNELEMNYSNINIYIYIYACARSLLHAPTGYLANCRPVNHPLKYHMYLVHIEGCKKKIVLKQKKRRDNRLSTK